MRAAARLVWCAAIGGALGVACLPNATPQSGERPVASRAAVKTARVSRGDLAGILTYTADLRAKQAVVLTTRVAGRLERLQVDVGGSVRQGDAVAELDRGTFEIQMLQSQTNLAAAEARLAGLQATGDPDARQEAEARLRAARARIVSLESAPRVETIPQLVQNLREARRRLDELETNRATLVNQAEGRLHAARGRLDLALTAQLGAPASPTTIDPSAIQQLRVEVQRAEEDLERARRPVTSEEIAGAKQAVAQAEDELLLARSTVGPAELEEAQANIEAAEARLRSAGAPASPAALRAAEAGVEYSWAALELARLHLREATIVAPITGLVTEIHQQPGVALGIGAPVVSLQPPDFELILSVEERNVGYIHIGHGVTIGVDSYPTEAFAGTVRAIAPAVDPRTRTVAAKVDVLDPRNKLKTGMFAQAAISGPRRSGVLLVPKEALLPGPETVVMQVVDGRARRQTVQVGLSDGKSVEVVQGLAEGAEVAIAPLSLLDGELILER